MEIITTDTKETIELGRRLGALLEAGDYLCLTGDLGAGKTHFTKGIAQGLGITEEIGSPTFTIVQEYDGAKRLCHFDWYRLSDEEELYAIGYYDYLRTDAVFVVEWPGNVESALPKERLDIRIEYGAQAEHRVITLCAFGMRYEALIRKMGGE